MAAEDHEIVSIYGHSVDQREQLMKLAPECVLMWATKDGWPVGVVHSFVWHDQKIWITFASHRHRAEAIRRDSRVSVNVSGRTSQDPNCPIGQLTAKGRASSTMMRTPRNGSIEHYQKGPRQIARRAKTLFPAS